MHKMFVLILITIICVYIITQSKTKIFHKIIYFTQHCRVTIISHFFNVQTTSKVNINNSKSRIRQNLHTQIQWKFKIFNFLPKYRICNTLIRIPTPLLRTRIYVILLRIKRGWCEGENSKRPKQSIKHIILNIVTAFFKRFMS